MTDISNSARRRLDTQAIAAELTEGAALGVMGAYFIESWPLGYVASAFAGGAGYVAVKLILDRFRKPPEHPSVMQPEAAPQAVPSADDGDLARRVAAMLEKSPEHRARRLRESIEAAGRIAERQGASWLVYTSPDAEPVVMGDREYTRLRRTARDLVEIETTWEGTKVSRLYLGRIDSSLKGLPSVQIHDDDGNVVREDWHVEGSPASEDEAMAAHEEHQPSASPGR